MKSFLQFFLEYRHNLADGTPAPSIHVDNGKNPNNLNKKNLHTKGEYKNKVPKLNIPGSILTIKDLNDLDVDHDYGKTIENFKGSGMTLHMTTLNGVPVARVYKDGSIIK